LTGRSQLGLSTTSDSEAVAIARLPARMMVNLYLLFGIIVLLVAGRAATDPLTRYGVGMAVEFGLAGAALLFIRMEGLPVRGIGRIRWAEPRTYLLALITVPGLWIAGVLMNLLSRAVFGYTTPATPAQFPRTWLEAVALAMMTIVVAPLCEEVMFRGYVQRAYERRNPWIGIAVGGVIFALYHLRFQGLFSLIPVSLALGLVAWRTESIAPAIVMHASFNAIATLLLVAISFLPGQIVAGLTFAAVFGAALMSPLSAGALWLLWRTTAPKRAPGTPRMAHSRRSWAWALPLAGFLAVYTYAAVTELLVHRYPQAVLSDAIDLTPATEEEGPVRWRYRIQDRLGREVGEAVCEKEPGDGTLAFLCEAEHGEVDLTSQMPVIGGGSWDAMVERLSYQIPELAPVLHAKATTWKMRAVYDRASLNLLVLEQLEETQGWAEVEISYSSEAQEVDLIVRPDGSPSELLKLPEGDILVGYEWPWRLRALPFRQPFGAPVHVLQRNEEGTFGVTNGFVHIQGAEPIWTPSGNYVTWRVNLSWHETGHVEAARDAGPAGTALRGNRCGEARVQTAWYDAQEPHTLVRFDDGAVSYILVATEDVEH
jgi:membrane protease YdiL (CAAX protease family)